MPLNEEAKAWASCATAKTNQTRLLYLTHNLMTLFEEEIRKREGLRDEKKFKRRAQRLAPNRQPACLTSEPPVEKTQNQGERLSQHTATYIRWLKNHFDQQRNWPKPSPTSPKATSAHDQNFGHRR